MRTIVQRVTKASVTGKLGFNSGFMWAINDVGMIGGQLGCMVITENCDN